MNAVAWSERFIAVPENRAALLAVEDLAERALRSVPIEDGPSLVVLHGSPGNGKTFLVQLLVELLGDNSSLVLTAREAHEVLRLEARGESGGRGKKLRTNRETDDPLAVTLLVVEDLQFLPAKSVERFVNVLDHRERLGLPTLVTASAGPAQLRHRDQPVAARLTARLASGLVVALPPLQPRSRKRFLEAIAERRGLEVPKDVIVWLADEVRGPRALESILAQLELLERIHGGLPRKELLVEHLRKQLDAQRPSVDRIAGLVAGHFQVAARELRTRERRRTILVPRQVSMYLARQLTPLSLQQIGAYFGGCDHSTVLHACRRVEQALEDDAVLRGTVRQLHDELC